MLGGCGQILSNTNQGPLIPVKCIPPAQAALMLDSGRFNLQANTDKIQHLLTFVGDSPLHLGRRCDS